MCSKLWTNQLNEKRFIYLDFKNFYPSILCSGKFPSPKDLKAYKTKYIPEEPGLLRVLLHINHTTSENIKQYHPFLLQSGPKGCPFYLNHTVETLIHTNEVAIWEKNFDVEPLEAITSTRTIDHPLKNKILKDLNQLEELKRSDPENPVIKDIKLKINCATTTPKIGQDKMKPSPYGVHCFPSQIVSNARALLFETLHNILKTSKVNVIQINTDGFLLEYDACIKDEKDAKNTLRQQILSNPYMGSNPGQLSVRGEGDHAFLLGPNTWWLTKEDHIVCELGTGRQPKEFETSPIPTHTEYVDHRGREQKINLLHLADFRHFLNKSTGERTKFLVSPEMVNLPLTPFTLIEQEKKRSWNKTDKEFEKFRKKMATQ
jgi:hypothetical protein